MPNNLFTPSGISGDPRPHQKGSAEGYKWGLRVTSNLEWLIDTGAQLSVVTDGTGASFDLKPVGGSASGTTGGGGIIVKSGLETVFEMFDTAGLAQAVGCSLDVGVKPNNAGGEIIGMDRVKHVGAAIEWDPGSGLGRLREP
jgi:hypothetical protein